MLMTELLRLTGEERWHEWGSDWGEYVDRVGELVTAAGAWVATARLRRAGYPTRRLDWGAVMFELAKRDLVVEFGAAREVRPSIGARRLGEDWSITIADLDDACRYGLVVLEIH